MKSHKHLQLTTLTQVQSPGSLQDLGALLRAQQQVETFDHIACKLVCLYSNLRLAGNQI